MKRSFNTEEELDSDVFLKSVLIAFILLIILVLAQIGYVINQLNILQEKMERNTSLEFEKIRLLSQAESLSVRRGALLIKMTLSQDETERQNLYSEYQQYENFASNSMQQLQKLGQQQMNLNQMTQMMNQGQLSQEMTAQMQRLAQQQEAIRKSLEQLNQEAKESGQSKRLAANLEKILNEMKEVVTNLQSEKVNNDLVKQQEKILSKLLDAQRSMNERDYENERKSDSGKNYSLSSPPDLLLNTDEGKNKLKDALIKAIKEGYRKDYEDLIRKYFEALEKARNEK